MFSQLLGNILKGISNCNGNNKLVWSCFPPKNDKYYVLPLK